MKKLLSVLMCALLLAALAVPAMAEDDPVTWLCSSNANQMAGYQALLDRFTAETGIPTELIAGSYDDLYPKLQSMIAAKQVPEFASWGTEFVPWAARGAMTPLTEFLKDSKINLDDFEASALEAMTWNGELYQLPYTANTCILYYNADLFDAAGVEYPTTDWDDTSWNWDAFVEMAKKLTLDSEGRNALDPDFDAENIVQFGVSGMQASWFYPWYFGGDWTNKEATEYTGYTEEAIKGVQSVYDLIYVDHVMPTSAQSSALANGGDVFATGKAAMKVDGNWSVSGMDVEFNWNIAASPIGTQHSLVQFTDGFGIGGGCANPEGMFAFLEWLYTDVDNMLEFLGASNGYLCIPTYKPVQEPIFAKIAEMYPNLNVDVLKNTTKVAEATPVWMRYNPNWNEFNTTLGNEIIDPIALGEKSAEEVMADPDIIEMMNEILNQEI